jgi:hypothetical protein
MFDPRSHQELGQQIGASIEADRHILEQLRAEIRPLRDGVRRIQPRSTTSISLVGTDGGNNKLQFDPFLVQIVRVVDSSNNEYCLEAITLTMSTSDLSARQFDTHDRPCTPLGRMMDYLGVRELHELSPMIPDDGDPRPRRPYWMQTYRELMEWAILFDLLRRKEFATDTLLLFDGLLRSKVFTGDLFHRLLGGIREAFDRHAERRRQLYLAGIAKKSAVYTRYRLAMMLEEVLTTDYPAYVEVPREIEKKAYLHAEYARDDDAAALGGEINKFVGGKMFFAKFGSHKRDPIWPVDIFTHQTDKASVLIGCLLSDAQIGFPVPHYPLSLQRAHENAALVEFDFDVLQDEIYEAVRALLGEQGPMLDVFALQDSDPSALRYT